MTTLETMRQENPNSWYLKDRAARERALGKPDSGKLERMEAAYLAAMGDRPQTTVTMAAQPCGLEFMDIPLYSQAWADLQRKFKKYKMTPVFSVSKVAKPDRMAWIKPHKDKRDLLERDARLGYMQVVTGWAK